MSIEVLKSISQTEAEADEIKRKSQAEARRIVSEASENSSILIENEVKAAEAKAKEIILKAEKEAEIEKEKLLVQVGNECFSLKEKSRQNMSKAVDLIVGRIVKSNGYS